MALYALAFLRLAQRDWVEAQPALEQALVYLRQQGIPFGVFRTLLALGHVLFAQGDVVGADTRCREGLALSRETPLLAGITLGLDGLALVASAQGLPLRAARLWGAAEALREATNERRWSPFQHAYNDALTAARTQVGEVEWTTAWAAGRALTADQAVAEALVDIDTPTPAAEYVPLVGHDSR